jgi:sodium/proline symporter
VNELTISFLLYTAGVAAVGLLSARFSRGTESDFLLADRGLGAWVAGLSSAASAESGWVTLGLVGYAFNNGIAAFWVVPGTVLAFLFNWFVLAPRLQRLATESNALTIPDLLACRFSGAAATAIRLLSVVIMLTMLTAYAAAQFNSAGKMFAATFDWNYSTGVLSGAAIVLLYTVTGGFRAIAWTDVVQSVLMVCALVLIPIILIHRMGGLESTWNTLQQMEDGPQLTHWVGHRSGISLLAFVTLWLGVPLGNAGQPHVMIRLMATKDKRAIFRGGIISTTWVFILFSGAVSLGIAARAYYGTLADAEQALPLIAADASIVPGFLGGLVLAAILAAICSTADSQLLVSATAISHDLMKAVGKTLSNPRRRLILDRISVVVVGTAAAAIALTDVRSIFDFVLAYGWAGLGAAFGPPMILLLLRPQTTGWGVVAGMSSGIFTAIIWKLCFPELNAVVYNLVPAFAISFGMTWCSSYAKSSLANAADGQ